MGPSVPHGSSPWAEGPRECGFFWDSTYNRNQLRGGCRRRPAYPFVLAIIAMGTNCVNTLMVATNSLLSAKIPCEASQNSLLATREIAKEMRHFIMLASA